MEEKQHKVKLLQDLKKATKDLQTTLIPIYTYTNLATIKPFLEIESQLNSILCNDPSLSDLSHLLPTLKTLLNELQHSQDYSLRSFIRSQIANYKISKISSTIEAKVQAWIDQESIKDLVDILHESNIDEEEKLKALGQFEKRVSNGFDRDLQEMVLKAKVYPILESIVSKSKFSTRVREKSARAIVALIQFNKDVFVGQVLMGPIVQTLVSNDSCGSIRLISCLMKLIKSPLAYEMEANGYIPRIIGLLWSEDFSMQATVFECVLELAYFATKDAIEAMIEQGLIKKLVELQRLEIKFESIDDDGESRGSTCEERVMERELTVNRPFTSCVTRFVVKLEMGQGLDLGEKRKLKEDILRRVRESSVSDAEAISIVAEVLWGSSPLLH